MRIKSIFGIFVAALSALLLPSCSEEDAPDEGGGQSTVPPGMVEVQPMLPGTFSALPRDPGRSGGGVSCYALSRTYEENSVTDGKLKDNPKVRLADGASVWLFAKNEADNSFTKKSYVVRNSMEDETLSFLVPCVVNDEGIVISMESSPLYLKENTRYQFFAVSPARALDETQFALGKIAFNAYNGEYFCANDCRYTTTTPTSFEVKGDDKAVFQVKLSPMINQTAELRFRIKKGDGVHDLDIQPSGIEVSGLQDDDPNGVPWHMSQAPDDEPIVLKHGEKVGTYRQYNYTIDSEGRVNIEVPVIPMHSLSKPVIVVFRLKVNGVPTSYEMMLNEKDFKAGYSYGYRGLVSIHEGLDVITWQFVSWDTEVDFP